MTRWTSFLCFLPCFSAFASGIQFSDTFPGLGIYDATSGVFYSNVVPNVDIHLSNGAEVFIMFSDDAAAAFASGFTTLLNHGVIDYSYFSSLAGFAYPFYFLDFNSFTPAPGSLFIGTAAPAVSWHMGPVEQYVMPGRTNFPGGQQIIARKVICMSTDAQAILVYVACFFLGCSILWATFRKR